MRQEIIIYILLFAGLIFVLRACSFSRKLLYFPAGISQTRLDFIKKYYKEVSEISIPVNDDHTLHGWLIQKDLKKYPLIIYFGGNAEEVSLNIEDFIDNMSANFLLLNYRGYGLSSGSPSEKKLLADSEKIYEFAASEYDLSPDRIYAMGRSLGSGIAVHLAVKKNLPKAILITPYTSIEETAKVHFPSLIVKFFLTDPFRADLLIKDYKNTVHIIAAADDEIIPAELAKRLYDQIDCRKGITIIQNAGHNTISNYYEYWSALQKAVLE